MQMLKTVTSWYTPREGFIFNIRILILNDAEIK